MPSIKINTYKNGDVKPEATVTIPSNVFKIAKRLIPKSAYTSLEAEGIDLAAIDELIANDEPLGVILEVENHKKNERTVISIE